MMAYHVPNTQHEDYYALDILNDILATGQSSRLYKSLIDEQQVASDLFTYLPESIDPNLFYIYAVAAKDISAETLKMAVVKEVNNIIKNGVNAKELEKVKNTKLVNFYLIRAVLWRLQ